MLATLVGVIIGGFLATFGSIFGSFLGDRRAQEKSQRAAQLAAAEEVLAALQSLVRKIVAIGRATDEDTDDQIWMAYHESATRWNIARYSAALVCPGPEVDRLDGVDRELDRLFGVARERTWTTLEFRTERVLLGRLGAAYLDEVREDAGLKPTPMRSLWSWDGGLVDSSGPMLVDLRLMVRENEGWLLILLLRWVYVMVIGTG